MAERRGLEGPQAFKAVKPRFEGTQPACRTPASIASVIGAAASRISVVGFDA
jgi:hypothetical protein